MYKYPIGIDLTPKSDISSIICEEVKKRYEWSNEVKSKKIPKWREIDNILTAYIPDNINSNSVSVKTSKGEKELIFNIPTSLAIKEIYLTTLYNIFLKSNAIHYIKGIGGDIRARVAGALFERVIAKQDFWFKKRLMLDAIWSDCLSYGISRSVLRWKKRTINKVRELDNTLKIIGMMEGIDLRTIERKFTDTDILFEGTELVPISPYDMILDARSPHYNMDSAEYAGWVWKTSKYELLKMEQDPENMMFNCRYIIPQKTTIYSERKNYDNTTESPVECITLCLRIIPNEFFGVNHISDRVENWLFTITSDDVVIQCHELNLLHGNFPVVDCVIGDTNEILPVSRLEIVYPFQLYASWLLKTRAESIINSINGKIIVDNSKVELSDVQDPRKHNFIRVKSTAYGEMDVRKYISQLQFSDTTQQYLNDIAIIEMLCKQGIGTTDIMHGNMTGMPERPTQIGINAIINASYGRVSRFAMIINELFMKEIGYQMCYNTQQFMSKDVFVPIAGYRYEQELKKEFGVTEDISDICVKPEMLKIAFEIEPKTQLEPIDTDTQGLVQLMQILLQVPEISAKTLQSYDLSRIFATVMRKLGIENLEDYKIEVKPDEEILTEAQKGNIVPVEKYNPQELLIGD